MKNYYVESPGRWFVVRTRTKRQAMSVGVKEFGYRPDTVREATPEEVEMFVEIKGEDALRDE